MADLAPAEWRWEDRPETALSDLCAEGDCERCPGRFLDMETGERFDCGHPCRHGKQEGQR